MTISFGRQSPWEKASDAVARRGGALLAWIWAHKWWYLGSLIVGAFLLAGITGPLILLIQGTPQSIGDLSSWPVVETLHSSPLLFGIVVGIAVVVIVVVASCARAIYRSQYRGKYDSQLANYVVRRVSELKRENYVPAHASEIDNGHPTARLVRHALRTAERSSLSRARISSIAPLPVGVCIFGEPLQDKTSLAWEAMRQVLPGWTFVKWPHHFDHPPDIERKCGMRVVLWLDDLHEYGNRLEAVRLDELIDDFAKAGKQVVVVATCRWHEDEREARAHLGYLLDHLLPIRLAATPGDRAADPVVVQPSMDAPIHRAGQTAPQRLAQDITDKRAVYRALNNNARAILRAMALLRSAGILVYTQERVRAIAPEFGLGASDDEWKQGLRELIQHRFIRPVPELRERRKFVRWLLVVWRWLSRRRAVGKSELAPVTVWYLDRVVSDEERQTNDPGQPLGEIWNALRPRRDTGALVLLGDAYLDPRRPYLRNSASQAVKCYSTALTALDRTQQPLQWVAGQIGLGNAHIAEAGRSSRRVRTEHLGEALTAYQEAASAAVQKILLGEAWQGVGAARRALAGDAIRRAETIEAGAQQADPNPPGANPPADAAALLEEARAAFDQSVDNFKQAHSPFQWATAHYELASVYKERALLESGPELAQEGRIDLLRKSVASYRLSSEVYTRVTAPTDWAKIQGELGESLLRLGEKLPAVDPGTRAEKLSTLQEAVEALRSSLTTFRQFGMHDNWAAISDKLGAALEQEAKALPDGQKKHDTLSQAVEAFSSALHHYTCERAPLEWAAVQIRLARTYLWQARLAATGLGLGDASINVAALARQAKECVERAIQEVYKPPYQSPFTSAHVQSSLRRSHVEAMELLRDINALQGQG